MDSYIDEIRAFLGASKEAMDIAKTAIGFMPRGKDADAAQERVEQAERALRASEAQLAQALGYHLCKCTFPPQIMLSEGRHEVHGVVIFRCQKCRSQEPSEHEIAQYDRAKAHNEGRRGGSWVGARRGR